VIMIPEKYLVEKYEQFCGQHSLDSHTAKSREIFCIYLKYRLQLHDEAVNASLGQDRRRIQFGSQE